MRLVPSTQSFDEFLLWFLLDGRHLAIHAHKSDHTTVAIRAQILMHEGAQYVAWSWSAARIIFCGIYCERKQRSCAVDTPGRGIAVNGLISYSVFSLLQVKRMSNEFKGKNRILFENCDSNKKKKKWCKDSDVQQHAAICHYHRYFSLFWHGFAWHSTIILSISYIDLAVGLEQ